MLTPRPFYYLRHGETDWNVADRCQGHTDIPLNQTGRQQAQRARDILARVGIATICASPLARAHETARIVAEAVAAPIVLVDDLKECGFGVREGEEIGSWHAGWLAGTATPEGGESLELFLARALRGINAALERPGPVLIVAHGGVYRAIRRHAALRGGEPVANCLPLHHLPPAEGYSSWRALPVF